MDIDSDRITRALANRIDNEAQVRVRDNRNTTQVIQNLQREIVQLKKELRNVGLLMTGVENLSERLAVVENKVNK